MGVFIKGFISPKIIIDWKYLPPVPFSRKFSVLFKKVSTMKGNNQIFSSNFIFINNIDMCRCVYTSVRVCIKNKKCTLIM